MTRRARLLSILAVAAALAAGAAHARADEHPRACPVPPDALEDDARLPATAARLHSRQALTIVAIGGASTAGTAAGNGQTYGYPRRLEEAMRRRHPGMTIDVVNKGVARQTAADMVQRFDKDVVPEHPTLVLWETGTVDAVRGNDVNAFAVALQDGIAALRQHNFDLMLLNMQYNPSTGSVIDFGPYLEALRNAADFENVLLFRRYEIMRTWSENGTFDFVDVPRDRRTVLAQEVYRCLGEALAEAIDHAAE